MRIEEAEARKAYIQRVRQSFDTPGRKYEFEKEAAVKGEEASEFMFMKIRFLIAALIFAAYVLFDQTGMKIYEYSTGEVAEKIAKDYDYIRAKEEAVQVFKSLGKSFQ